MNDGAPTHREPISSEAGPLRGGAAQRLLIAWQQNEQPNWLDFAADVPSDSWLDLFALIRVDQDQRWRRGNPVQVEHYLQRCVRISTDQEHVLDLVASEILLRRAHGELPQLDQYSRRFPDAADALKILFAQHAAFDASLDLSFDGTDNELPPSSADHRPTLFWSTAPQPSAESVTAADGPTLPTQRPAVMAGLPEMIGNYRLEGILGRGGMGVVYKARDRRLKRLVALKMLSSFDNPDDLLRFKAEAEIYARLQHPHIVQIFEVGQHEGRLFLVLELVTGGSLADRLKGVPLPARSAAEMVATLAAAVHVAHLAGIVHRDLKPGNVLLAADDTPKVTDFGLAKSMDQPSDQTQTGALIGTPSYMAPEQACGKGKNAGPTIDVYALGAILYEALTGRPPFRGQTTLDTLDQVRSAEPVAPVTLQPKLPRDLNTICLKCLEKSPEKRYATALLLSEDLKRFLSGNAILARPVSSVERLMKWTRRRPAVAAMAAIVVCCLLTLAIGGTFYSVSLSKALDQVARERDTAWRATNLAKAEATNASRQTTIAEQRFDQATRLTFALQLNQLAQLAETDPAHARQMLFDQSFCPEKLRDFTWRHLLRACSRQAGQVEISETGAARCLAVSLDGQRMAIGMDDGQIVLKGRNQKSPNQKTLTFPPGPINCLAFVPGSDLLAIGSGAGTIAICDVSHDGAIQLLQAAGESVNDLAVSHDGRRLASGGSDRVVRVWDLASAKVQQSHAPDKGSIFSLDFSPDDQRLAIGFKNDEAQLWEPASDQSQALVGHRGWVTAVAWSPDGKSLATGSIDRTVRLWDVASCQSRATLVGHDALVASLAWDGDSTTVYSCGYDKKAIAWNAVDGTLQTILRSQGDELIRIAIVNNSQQKMLTGVGGRRQQSWDLNPNLGRRSLNGHTRPITALAFVAGTRLGQLNLPMSRPSVGPLLITAAYDRTWRIWNPDDGQPIGSPHETTQWITALAVSADGLLAMGDADGKLQIYDRLDLPPRIIDAHQLGVSGLAFGSDGSLASVAAGENAAKIWQPSTGKLLATIQSPTGSAFNQLACGSAGAMILATDAGEVSVAAQASATRGNVPQAASGWHSIQLDRVTAIDRAPLRSIAYEPRRGQITAARADGQLSLLHFNARDRSVQLLSGHQGGALTVAYAPGGETLVSGGADQALRFWDATVGHQRLAVNLAHGDVTCLAFSADGSRLACGCGDGSVQIWYASHTAD